MKTILWVLLSLGTSSSFAGTPVADGLRLYFSPRGQTYFKENLETVLKRNDLDLSKNQWDEIQFELDAPEFREFFRNRLGSYFYGFPINPPRIQVKLLGSDLPVKFRAMGAEVDQRGPGAYGKKSGVIILMHLEAEAVEFSTGAVRIEDLANPGFFGVMGIDRLVSASTGGRSRPVRVEIPVHVDAGAKGALVTVLKIRSNIEESPFTLGFDKLLLPTITLSVNGKDYSFDKVAFEQELRSMLPELSDLLIGAVKSYFEKSGKKLIQPSFNDLAENLNINFTLGITPKENLNISLIPTRTIYTKSNHLGLSFSAEVLGRARGMVPAPGIAKEPTLVEVDAGSYDVSLVIHPAALNTVLERAWKRGLLKDIEIGKDPSGRPEVVKLPKAPVVSFTGLPTTNLANIHATIGYSVRGLGRILFKGPIPIELDLRVKLETNSKNEVEIVLDQIDEKTLKIDTRATWLFPIRAKVERMVRERLAKLNDEIRTKRTLMTSLPTLDDLLEIPLHLDGVKTDAGNLVLFADFAVN